MNLNRLARIDLNLLVALHILLQEGSVSRAADKLSITQPAMSKTLGRLRETFDDPLFVRSKRGIQPTPRALGLAGELKSVLGQIDGLLDAGTSPPPPSKAKSRWRYRSTSASPCYHHSLRACNHMLRASDCGPSREPKDSWISSRAVSSTLLSRFREKNIHPSTRSHHSPLLPLQSSSDKIIRW